MIAIIRITGKVDVPQTIKETLLRLKLKKKYSCIVVKENKEILGMLRKIRSYVAYGKIDNKTFKELLEKRGKVKKEKAEEVIKNFKDKDKKLSELGIKDVFNLHPPRGGINTKKHFPRGVLGENKKIDELIKRML